MASGPRAAPCNTECYEPSAVLESTQTEPEARWRTGYTTHSPPSSNAGVSVYRLMKLLGDESLVTSQRYVTAAGSEARSAVAKKKLHEILEQSPSKV